MFQAWKNKIKIVNVFCFFFPRPPENLGQKSYISFSMLRIDIDGTFSKSISTVQNVSWPFPVQSGGSLSVFYWAFDKELY